MNDNLIVKTHFRTPRAIYDTLTLSHEELTDISGKNCYKDIRSVKLFHL